MKSNDLPDPEIINRILDGEKELYRVIIQRYTTLVLHVVRRYETDTQQSEEMAHDVFLKVYERLGQFRGNAAFSSWIYRLAHNHCLDQTRRNKYRQTIYTEMPDHNTKDMEDLSASADKAILAEDTSAILEWAMGKISDKYIVPLLMKYRDGFSYDEISRDLKVPVGALKVRVHRARKELKNYLEQVI
ncbi:RNA polymerase sigma factor [Natronogracilivirga saccharolytica]|uniref:RNA polymerase sigma factor n=1 Tax=Natronogracilivirga saccharolytica TaxID=2812953 RepID=A0A8J7RIS7_9BACT|nr:RNA polymerase sigma factor [Natronogracilivirga saccharolytica]MBP3191385.1 RNA polymerase sigma factor [Natronogracilivirga saccharolytica]